MRWENNFSISPKEIGYEDANRTKLAQDHIWWLVLVIVMLKLVDSVAMQSVMWVVHLSL
jgi:hypothetical protein